MKEITDQDSSTDSDKENSEGEHLFHADEMCLCVVFSDETVNGSVGEYRIAVC